MSVILALAVWLSGGTTWFLPFVGYAESPEAGVGVMYPDCASVNQLGAAWYQDWTPAPPLCDEYSRPLAMIWSYHGGPLPQIPSYAWGVMLGNEPNLPEQANMTVAETAELSWVARQTWPRARLLSPATFNDAYFMFQVYEHHERMYGSPPSWDVIAVHCYFATAQGCIDYIQTLRELSDNYNPPLPLLVTEWAILPCSITTQGVRGQPDMARAQYEATQLRAWFESQPDILAHLWFAAEYAGDEWCVWQPHPACDTALLRDGRYTEWGYWFMQGRN